MFTCRKPPHCTVARSWPNAGDGQFSNFHHQLTCLQIARILPWQEQGALTQSFQAGSGAFRSLQLLAIAADLCSKRDIKAVHTCGHERVDPCCASTVD